ncbi:hypothetical protein F0726_00175 [Acidithiobacillus caldus]|nr:hypothetical protein F0726_00175 [Acidithiobacillus caldus]
MPQRPHHAATHQNLHLQSSTHLTAKPARDARAG